LALDIVRHACRCFLDCKSAPKVDRDFGNSLRFFARLANPSRKDRKDWEAGRTFSSPWVCPAHEDWRWLMLSSATLAL
jgi:hypothetical protein